MHGEFIVNIYLLGKSLILPLQGQCTSTLRKERRLKKKQNKIQRAKNLILTQEIDAFIGDEEKERNRDQDPNPATLDQ